MLVLLWRRTFRLLVLPAAKIISRIHSISDIHQSSADKERNVEESNVNIKQVTGNIEQSSNVEHSRSNVVQSINNDKGNEPSTIEQNTGTIEQSTNNVVQSSIIVQQCVDVVNNNSEKCSGINVGQNIDVVNNNSDECSMVKVVADSQPVESLSSFEYPPTWAEVVAVEEAANFSKPAPSMKPVQERKARALRRSFRFACSGLPVRLRSASHALANVAWSAKSSS